MGEIQLMILFISDEKVAAEGVPDRLVSESIAAGTLDGQDKVIMKKMMMMMMTMVMAMMVMMMVMTMAMVVMVMVMKRALQSAPWASKTRRAELSQN